MANTALSDTLTSNNDQVLVDVGNNTAFSAVVTGTFVGTITLQVLYDTVEGWVTATCFTRAGVGATAVLTAPGNRIVNTANALAVRALMTPFTSGTAEVTLSGSPAIAAAAGGSGAGAVTIADGADGAEGTTTDAGIITDIAGTQIGFLRGAIKMWITHLARMPAALGGTTSAASLPVVLSSDGPFAVQTGSVTETAPATDTASSGLNGRLQRIAQRLTSLIALLPAALGGTTSANSLPVVLSSDGPFATQTGSITETAPATDTASSGLNGRLQRIAQRLTSLVAFFGLTNNNAAPGAAHIGVLSGIANATAPTWTEGNTVLGSVDLHGSQRVAAGGFAPAAPTCTFTRGANTTPYTIGDEVGTAGTTPTTVAVARYNGGSGVILGAQVVYSSYTATVPQLVVMLFSASVTLAGDNAQLNLSDGDAALCIGIIPLTVSQTGQYSAGAAVAAGNTLFFGAPTAPIEFVAGASQTTIYGALITLNAWTPIANSETAILTLRCEQN